MQLNEDFLDNSKSEDVISDDVDSDSKFTSMTPEQWNAFYAKQFTHMFAIFIVATGQGVGKRLQKFIKNLEVLINQFYPGRYALQPVFSNHSSYDKEYESIGCQYETPEHPLFKTEYKNSVYVKFVFSPSKFNRYLTFFSAMTNFIRNTKFQPIYPELYISDGNVFVTGGEEYDRNLTIYDVIPDDKPYYWMYHQDSPNFQERKKVAEECYNAGIGKSTWDNIQAIDAWMKSLHAARRR